MDDRLRHDPTDAGILVVGEDPADVRLLKRFLKRAGYRRVATAGDPRAAVRSSLEVGADVVLVDADLQRPDAFEVMEQLQCATPPDAYPPAFVLVGNLSASTREEALEAGVKCFLGRPLDYTEVLVCMGNLLDARVLRLQLSEIAHGISNSMSVIRNYADSVVAGIDQRAPQDDLGWSETRRDAAEVRLAAHRAMIFINQVLSLRSDEHDRHAGTPLGGITS